MESARSDGRSFRRAHCQLDSKLYINEVLYERTGKTFEDRQIAVIAIEHCVTHLLSVVHFPWVSETVESCIRHVQAANRTIQNEMILRQKKALSSWDNAVYSVKTAEETRQAR